jgi:hypothetical protein
MRELSFDVDREARQEATLLAQFVLARSSLVGVLPAIYKSPRMFGNDSKESKIVQSVHLRVPAWRTISTCRVQQRERDVWSQASPQQ